MGHCLSFPHFTLRRAAYETVVMVGDGITDLEAVQESGGADMFVGFGGEPWCGSVCCCC